MKEVLGTNVGNFIRVVKNILPVGCTVAAMATVLVVDVTVGSVVAPVHSPFVGTQALRIIESSATEEATAVQLQESILTASGALVTEDVTGGTQVNTETAGVSVITDVAAATEAGGVLGVSREEAIAEYTALALEETAESILEKMQESVGEILIARADSDEAPSNDASQVPVTDTVIDEPADTKGPGNADDTSDTKKPEEADKTAERDIPEKTDKPEETNNPTDKDSPQKTDKPEEKEPPEAKDDVKEESKDDSKDGLKEDPKEDPKDDSKEDPKDDPKDDAKETQKDDDAKEGETRTAEDDDPTKGAIRPQPDTPVEDTTVSYHIRIGRVIVDEDDFAFARVYFTVEGLKDTQSLFSSQLYAGDKTLASLEYTDRNGDTYYLVRRTDLEEAEQLKARVGIIDRGSDVGPTTSEQFKEFTAPVPEKIVPQIQVEYYKHSMTDTTKTSNYFMMYPDGNYASIDCAILYFWDRKIEGYLYGYMGDKPVYKFDLPAGMELYHGMPIEFYFDGTVVDSDGETVPQTGRFSDIVEIYSGDRSVMPDDLKALMDDDGHYTGTYYDVDGNETEGPVTPVTESLETPATKAEDDEELTATVESGDDEALTASTKSEDDEELTAPAGFDDDDETNATPVEGQETTADKGNEDMTSEDYTTEEEDEAQEAAAQLAPPEISSAAGRRAEAPGVTEITAEAGRRGAPPVTKEEDTGEEQQPEASPEKETESDTQETENETESESETEE